MSYNSSDFDREQPGLREFLTDLANKLLYANGIFNFFIGDEYSGYN